MNLHCVSGPPEMSRGLSPVWSAGKLAAGPSPSSAMSDAQRRDSASHDLELRHELQSEITHPVLGRSKLLVDHRVGRREFSSLHLGGASPSCASGA